MSKVLSSARLRLLSVIAVIAIFAGVSVDCPALDIGPMTWTPRSEWINVKTCSTLTGGPNAVGNGVADDTTAIQDIYNYINAHSNGTKLTVYFPAGTYKITSTLFLGPTFGVNILGCGSNTTMSWAGATGGAMFETYSNVYIRFVGFVWNGNNLASCAYEQTNGSTGTRHENESFKNFTAAATYSYTNSQGNVVNSPEPPTSAILAGATGLDSEVMIYNCAFSNCTTGVVEGWAVGNNLMWDVDSCEFENCGEGINFYGSACMMISNSHFQNTTNADITGGHQMRVRHCTSSSSGSFYNQWGGVPFSPDVLEDCWVDSWTNPNGAVYFYSWGPNTVFDCNFTNPPSDSASPVCLDTPGEVMSSNNYYPGLPPGIGFANSDDVTPGIIANIQPGLRGGAITSAAETFLQTSYPADSTHIIDVTQAPYSAPNNFNGDAAPAIQAAINAAKTANNGSIVYIPSGMYQLLSTLNVSGSNYSIEGEGNSTELCWIGAESGTMMSITTPKKMSIELLRFAVQDATITGIQETSTGASNIVYDEVHVNAFTNGGNPGAGYELPNGLGLVLTNLPAGSTVYMPHDNFPLTVQNCGPAQIFSKFLQNGVITVSGTSAKTGFLGTMIAEGEQVIPNDYNIVINDNQDLVIGDYYTEQCQNDISLSRGGGTGTGRVTIQGLNSASGENNGTGQPTLLLNVNNYQGRVFYGSLVTQDDNSTVPIQINQTGANPIDMILPSNLYSDGVPTITTASGANLITTQDVETSGGGASTITDYPNPLTASNYLSMALGLDHLRQLEAVDLSVQYGITTDGPPVAQYPFENNVLDMTTNYNGTNSGATFVGGLGTNAAQFNGTNAYVKIPKSISTNFSVAMWVQTTDTGGTGQWYGGKGLVDGYTKANASDWGTALNAGKFSLGIGNPDTTLTSTVPVNDGNWHHVVATRNSSTGAMQVYVDGVLNTSTTGPTGTRSAAANDRIGSIQTGVSGGFLNGTIDEVQIFNYVLSATDVAYLYNHTKALMPLSTTGQVAYWKLDETSGPSSFDSSGNNITGTWVNGPTFTTDKPSAITFTDAGSLLFNGSNQYVTMGTPPQLPSGNAPRTLCAWAKNAGGGNYHMFASYGSASTDAGMWLGANGTSLSAGSWGDDMPDIPNFWDGNWHFICMTFDGTTANLYADGVLKETASKPLWNLVPNVCYVGCYLNGGAFWNGSVDDVRIYNRALSATEVSQLAAGNLNP
jgi:hypothetical protein